MVRVSDATALSGWAMLELQPQALHDQYSASRTLSAHVAGNLFFWQEVHRCTV
jgi:hypothetical protein